MLPGAFRLLTVFIVPPAGLSSTIVPFPAFATQALPLASTATAAGAAPAAPVLNPLEVDTGVPLEFSLVTLALPPLLSQTAPAASVAIDVGALSPPPT